MTKSQHAQVEDIFNLLCENDPSEHQPILSAVEDPEVHAEVVSLLRHAGPRTKNVETPIEAMMAQACESGAFAERTIGPGTRFERYRIERMLGHGGMGDVYAAVRENDFHKQVALKIVRYGLDSEYARNRFQQERQTLAGLEHPYIARLLDGGEAENGCPFLVLELVDGVPVNEYCEGHAQDEVLKIFLKVCEAVEYAHRNLIIHRDLKPANILVTAEGDPKLLDFGIAKLLDGRVDATQTLIGAMTPQYASPEQIMGRPMTTASDVYSLGVVLYQLLTRRKPYQLETTTAVEMARLVCQEPPSPPGLGSELDDILLMALRKEPERRYRSVLELAQDIRRYMDGLAVFAAPDTFRYRSGKFIARYRLGLAAVATVIVVLAAGLGSTLYQMRRAERERQQAEQRFQQVRKLSNTFLFDIHDQLVDIAGTTKARAFVVKTARTYLDDLAGSAGSDPLLRAELAQAYERLADAQAGANKANLGDVAGAEASHRQSIALYEGLAQKDPKYIVNSVESWRLLGFLYIYQTRLDEATHALDRAVQLAARLRDDKSSRALTEMGTLYGTLQQAAEQRFDADAQVLNGRLSLGYFEAAAKLASKADEARTAILLGRAHTEMGRAYMAETDMAAAEPEYRLGRDFNHRAFELNRESARARTFYSNSVSNLMTFYSTDSQPSADRARDAGPYARESIALLEPMLAADPNDITSRMNYVAALIADAQSQAETKPAIALQQTRRAEAMWSSLSQQPALTAVHRYLGLDDQRSLVTLFTRLGAFKEARQTAEVLLRERRKLLAVFPPGDDNYWFLSDDLRAAAEAARLSGDRAASERMLDEALRVCAPFAAAAERQTTTAFFASRLYRSLALARASSGECAEAYLWQHKAKTVWAQLAPKYPYAAQQASRTATFACSV